MSQGEAYLQLCDFQSAAACYKRACLLEPRAYSARLAFVYHLQVRVSDLGLMLLLLLMYSNSNNKLLIDRYASI